MSKSYEDAKQIAAYAGTFMALEQSNSNMRSVLIDLRDTFEKTYQLSAEGRSYLEKINRALEDHRQDPPYAAKSIAAIIANEMGDDLDTIPKNKADWLHNQGKFGSRFRDINEPMYNDYMGAAEAVLSYLLGRKK